MKQNIRRITLFLMLLTGLTLNMHNGHVVFSTANMYACYPWWYWWAGGGPCGDGGGSSGGSSGDGDGGDGNGYTGDGSYCNDVCDPACANYNPDLCDRCNPDNYYYEPDYCVTVCDPSSPNYDPSECDKVCDIFSNDYNASFCNVCACSGDDEYGDGSVSNAPSLRSMSFTSSSGSATCPLDLNDFDYTMEIDHSIANLAYDSRYNKLGWCAFSTLAAIRGGTPCAWARAYCRMDNLCYRTCWDVPCYSSSHPVYYFYNRENVWVTPTSIYSIGHDGICDMLNKVAPGGKGILVEESDHVYLVYGFHRHAGDTSKYDTYNPYLIDKFDTRDINGWDRQTIQPGGIFSSTTSIVYSYF